MDQSFKKRRVVLKYKISVFLKETKHIYIKKHKKHKHKQNKGKSQNVMETLWMEKEIKYFLKESKTKKLLLVSKQM